MKLVKATDNENYLERLVSEDGRIEMGVYPVIFGYRIRAGYTGKQWCEVDWCAGADQKNVEMAYAVLKNIIEAKATLQGIPSASKIKPLINDLEFLEQISKLTVGKVSEVKLKPVNQYRETFLNNHI